MLHTSIHDYLIKTAEGKMHCMRHKKITLTDIGKQQNQRSLTIVTLNRPDHITQSDPI